MATSAIRQFSPSLRPDTQRTDSGFSETPRKRTRRAGVHTPVLQSIDTSPASIDAFQRRHDLAAPMQLRPFIQGAIADGDIFGLSLPPAATFTPDAEPSARKPRADLDSSALDMEADLDENRASGFTVCEDEPRKAPTWVRQGPPVPLGELRLDDPRASLDFDTTLDLSEEMDVDDEQMAEQRGKEWPPSPKKSPVKRRLLFQPAPAANQAARDREAVMFEDFASVHGDVDDSILGGADGTFTWHQQRQAHSTPLQADHLEEHDRPSSLPQLQKPERPAARGRKSLLRRRRTTNMHEDPITSPRLDPSTRVSKPAPRSRQSSAESQAGLGNNAALLGIEEAEVPRSIETPPSAEPSVEESLWVACGRDLRRWNMGDFDTGNALGIDASILW